ncbi:iron ABC transporter permease [Streptomyces sp. NTH33]|nr:iron ABC transporter permease [Streptomyces sp. NTH33]PZH20288.1 iron ABC transporter permease [Streptomyces sp. NTH33]
MTSARSALTRARREIPGGIIAVVLALLIVLPVAFIVVAALTTEVPRPGNAGIGSFTSGNFGILATQNGVRSLLNSVGIGAGAAVVSLVIGASLAFIAARTDAPWRRFIFIAGMAPMFLPSIVGSLAWSLLASPTAGYLNIALRDLGVPVTFDVYSYGGLVFVLGVYYAPYTFMLTHSSFSMMNADLEEASAVHGASLWSMLRTVTLPLAVPALAGAAILSFALSLENFPVNAILGNPGGIETLPTYIYHLMAASPVRANAAAGIAVALTAALLVATYLQQRVVNRKRFTTLSGKGNRPRPVPLRWGRRVATGFAVLYFVVSVVLPVLALIVTSTSGSVYVNHIADMFSRGFTLERLSEAIGQQDFLTSTVNSVVVAVVAAVLGTTIAFSTSYIRYRTTSRLGQLLEQVSMSPLAIPQVVLGMGILWAWLILPVSLYGTIALLAVATVAVTMPQAYRSVSSSMLQLDPDLENSAVLLGARRFRAIRNVTVPLMRTGIVSTLLLLLMLGMREMSAVLFLYTSDTRVLSILVFQSFENGSLSFSAAISLVFVVVIAVIAVSAQLAAARERRFNGAGA